MLEVHSLQKWIGPCIHCGMVPFLRKRMGSWVIDHQCRHGNEVIVDSRLARVAVGLWNQERQRNAKTATAAPE